MKIVSRTTILALMTLLFAYGVVSRSVSITDDVKIETLNNGSIYCDSLICPEGTTSCQVTKRNDPNNASQIVRKRKCFGENGNIITETTIYEPNKYNGNVNINVVSGGQGFSQSFQNAFSGWQNFIPPNNFQFTNFS